MWWATRNEIAILSFGRPAEWLQNDRGSTCDLAGTQPCDPFADAVQNASSRMLVVVAAGNAGDLGTNSPFAYNSVQTPAVAPAALAVGATTNSQRYRIPIRLTGDASGNSARSSVSVSTEYDKPVRRTSRSSTTKPS